MLNPPIERLAQSTEEVLEFLSLLIDWGRENRSRLGYFASIYRKVTIRIRDDIQNGIFEDGPRMDRFDLIFANRYFQALIDRRNGVAPTESWVVAFDSAESYWPIVVQHYLLGMNAHINLDLGIAAAETMRGRQLEDLRTDFNHINVILAALIDRVQKELADVWVTLRVFNSVLGSTDDALIRFSMNRAREEAWRSAGRFWATPEADWPAAIAVQDRKVAVLGRLVRRPGILLGAVTKIVRLGEVQDVARVMDILG